MCVSFVRAWETNFVHFAFVGHYTCFTAYVLSGGGRGRGIYALSREVGEWQVLSLRSGPGLGRSHLLMMVREGQGCLSFVDSFMQAQQDTWSVRGPP